MTVATLRADCARCAALCCVVLAFDRSEFFAIDKPAGKACPNLDAGDRCRFHAELTPGGFSGCVRYDCAGAGQRVTQEVFGGRSWRDDAALMQPMARAFTKMRIVQDLLVLLQQARTLGLSVEEQGAVDAFERALEPESGWTYETLMQANIDSTAQQVHAFMRTLGKYIADGTSPRA